SPPLPRRSFGEGGSTSQLSVSAFQFFRFSAFALAWLVLVEVGVEFWYRSHERNLRASAQWTVRWPEHAPEFRQVHIDERTRTVLNHDEGRGATWHDKKHGIDAVSLLYLFR